MTYARRLILALALSAGIAPALAQVPPPVPALPDTERRTAYTISASQCTCAVNMALYGDSTDYQNWVEVWLNGALIPASGNWTITSPTGSLGSIPRPITDAVLTFTNAQTGTVQIVGARRPRRVSQFNENQGVPARNLNQALTDIIAQNRELWDKTNDITGRGLFSQPGNAIGLLPIPSLCANAVLTFDATGLNPVCLIGAGSGNMLGPVTATAGHAAIFGATPNLLTDAGAAPALATTTISTTAPLTGGGSLAANRTLAITSSALTSANDTNVTVTLGGTPASALLAASSITMGWTGTLAVSRGGTGLGSGTSGGIPYFQGASTMASSGVLVTNQIVIGGGAGGAPAPLGSYGSPTTVLHGSSGTSAPTFGAVALGTDVTGTLPKANGGLGATTLSSAIDTEFSSVQGSVLYRGASGWLALGPGSSGQLLATGGASANPSWITASGTGTVTSVICGTGLTGGTITASGTCAFALNSATLQASPGAPTGTTSTLGVMMGVGGTCKITPTYSTRVKLEFIGNVQGTGGTSSFTALKVFYGTGSAPANGAALTGTQIGNQLQATQTTANIGMTFADGGVITGLSPGTAYWFDVSIAANNSANTSTVTNLSCNAFEVL